MNTSTTTATATATTNTANVINGRNNWNIHTVEANLPELLEAFKEAIRVVNKTYLPSSEVLKLIPQQEEVVMKEVPVRLVRVYTDGSCDAHSTIKSGGWGVFLECGAHTKELSGAVTGTTNNLMELEALIQALLAVDTSKKGFVFEFVTDSKYVLHGINNKHKHQNKGFGKAKNPESLVRLYDIIDQKGIVFTNTIPVNNAVSGDTVFSTADGTIKVLWERGHSDCGGNAKADALAVSARKSI